MASVDKRRAEHSRLTPEQRVLRARIANAAMRAKCRDLHAHTAAARAKSPGNVEWHADRLDPEHKLPEAERIRRGAATNAYFLRLAFRSSTARNKPKQLPADAELAALESDETGAA